MHYSTVAAVFVSLFEHSQCFLGFYSLLAVHTCIVVREVLGHETFFPFSAICSFAFGRDNSFASRQPRENFYVSYWLMGEIQGNERGKQKRLPVISFRV